MADGDNFLENSRLSLLSQENCSQCEDFLGSQDWTLSQGLRIEKANVEMIAQFQNVTGTDDKVSKYYLESSKDRCGNWNLEDAIASFYKDLGAAQPYVWTAKNHRDDYYFDFEFFITSGDAGLYQIAIEIFTNMSIKDLMTMRAVNKTINAFIRKERSIFTRKIKKPILFRIENLTSHDMKEFDRWLKFLKCIEEEGSLAELFYVIPINRKYISIDLQGRPLSPFKVAVELRSLKLVKIIKSFDLLKFEERFHKATGQPPMPPRCMEFFNKATRWNYSNFEVQKLLHPILLSLFIKRSGRRNWLENNSGSITRLNTPLLL